MLSSGPVTGPESGLQSPKVIRLTQRKPWQLRWKHISHQICYTRLSCDKRYVVSLTNESSNVQMYQFTVVYHLLAVCQSHKHTLIPHPSPSAPSSPPSPPPPPPPPARMPFLSSADVFFRLGVQGLSCPQHVLVLRSSAARTCDDRVCERWGVSGVKCVYRGCMAGSYVWDTPKNTSFHLVTSCAERTGQNGCYEENAYLELCSDGPMCFNDNAFILYKRQ